MDVFKYYFIYSGNNGVIDYNYIETIIVKIFSIWNGSFKEIKINLGVMDEKREVKRVIKAFK